MKILLLLSRLMGFQFPLLFVQLAIITNCFVSIVNMTHINQQQSLPQNTNCQASLPLIACETQKTCVDKKDARYKR